MAAGVCNLCTTYPVVTAMFRQPSFDDSGLLRLVTHGRHTHITMETCAQPLQPQSHKNMNWYPIEVCSLSETNMSVYIAGWNQ